jgi:hypothetical protein
MIMPARRKIRTKWDIGRRVALRTVQKSDKWGRNKVARVTPANIPAKKPCVDAQEQQSFA